MIPINQFGVLAIFVVSSAAAACPTDSTSPGTTATPTPQLASSGELAPGAAVSTSPDDAVGPDLTRTYKQQDPRYGLLTPLPDSGAVPPILEIMHAPTQAELEFRAKARGYQQQIRLIRNQYLGPVRAPKLRQQGLAELREFTDPAAFAIMYSELRREADDVRTAVLDHIAQQGDLGQATLAWIAVYDAAKAATPIAAAAVRQEALSRMTQPASLPVVSVLDQALRNPTHEIANNAGIAAGSLHVLQTIPLLIFAQVTQDEVAEQGDLAWIAITTQEYFVTEMRAVVQNGVVAFVPVIAPQSTGVLLRVVDAVAISYRTDIHRALVSITSYEWGRSTEELGYDPAKWWTWYNQEFVPHMRHKVELEKARAEDSKPPQPAAPAPGAGQAPTT